jgi:Ca2+-binding RTX toxin-like protein
MIMGLGGADEITDGFGADLVYGGKGKDNLVGYGATPPWTASTAASETTSSNQVTVPRSRTRSGEDRVQAPSTRTTRTRFRKTASG